ncbi:MAG: hydantoinase B/oxoprolinase family protein [Chromatiales bacterium]
MDPVELSIFSSRLEAVCDEMGAVLRNAAFSPNIRDRLDFSCAVFDARGELCAQAAHIPVHLGSMAYAMRGIVERLSWSAGDAVILNDPYLGGTHLPDVTLISPVFAGVECLGFVVNRAHHADIGAEAPGSMPVSSSLAEEGLVIPPTHLVRAGRLDPQVLDGIAGGTRNPEEAYGDFSAQLSANRTGVARLKALVDDWGPAGLRSGLAALNDYAERLALGALSCIPEGDYGFCDLMDDDGQGTFDIPIRVRLSVREGRADVSFAGTSAQVRGNINCPLSVAAAAVFYVFRCLMPPQTPACEGAFRPIRLSAPEGCLLNARPPAGVAAGNVETSSRVVDAVLGALALAMPERLPAASHGSMNNLAMGSDAPGPAWDYYETIGGGMGAGPAGGGLSGVQTHMTNTRNTPVEVVESRFPLRVTRYALRRGSGGRGLRPGGDGLVRELQFLAPARVSLLTERRRHAPWGSAGGGSGTPGRNLYNDAVLPPKAEIAVSIGDRIRVESAGGGGWGSTEGR